MGDHRLILTEAPDSGSGGALPASGITTEDGVTGITAEDGTQLITEQ